MRGAVIPFLVGLAVLVPSAGAQTPDVARLQAEFRDEQARARRLRADAAQATAEIADLEREMQRLRGDLTTQDVQLQSQRARLNTLGQREAALSVALSRVRARQGRLLSALQTMSRRPPPPLLIPADRAVDTVRAAILMRAMAPAMQTEAQALVARQTEVQRIRRLAALSSERLFTSESAQGDRRAEIESLTARKAALQTVLRAEQQAAERASRVLEARIRDLGGAVPVEDADGPVVTASRPAGRDRLRAPIAGPTSERGATSWRWRADAATVAAPAAGRVAFVGPLTGWGRVVILDLGPGWRAVLSGLDTTDVQTGDRIADGQTLGRSAADGEIQFELRRDERPIDPGPWLR